MIDLLKPKVMFLNSLLLTTNSHKLKDIHFTVIKDKEEQLILLLEGLKQ